MRRFLCLTSVMLLLSAGAHARFVPATDPGISYSGRWITSDTERHATSAGQRFRFQTTATSCTLELAQAGIVDDNAHIAVRIDGGPWNRQAPRGLTEDSVVLYEGLPGGLHTVEVVITAVYRGTPFIGRPGRFMLKGLTLPDGASLSPLPYPNRHAVLLGDSISCGFLMTMNSDKLLAMDAQKAAGQLFSEWTGCDVTVVAVPGIGFNKNGDSVGVKALEFLQDTASGTPWAPPDTSDVFINLGTNDGASVTPDAVLMERVQEYLAAVRVLFPGARVTVLRPFNGNRAGVIRQAVETASDTRMRYVDTSGWLDLRPGYDTSDGVHPNASGSTKYARQLMDLFSGSAESLVPGDCDGDGAVTLRDAAEVVRAVGGL